MFEIAPLGPPVPVQPRLLAWLLPAAAAGLGLRVAPQGHCPWPPVRGGFSRPPLTLGPGCLLPAATGLGRGIAPLNHCPWRRTWGSSSSNPEKWCCECAALNRPASLENSAVATGLEKVSFHSSSKKGNAKECSNYSTIALISHASKVMLKILQARLQ